MQTALIPADESARLRSLRRLEVLDTPAEEEFDALVRAAALVCGVPISLITLIDETRQWFKATAGVSLAGTPRDPSFCAHAILQDDVFEVPDMTADARFAGNPFVTGKTRVRFYAGATLKLRDGANVGTLCVLDTEPRRLTAEQRQVLMLLAKAAVAALEGRRALLVEARFRTLSEASPLGVFETDARGQCTYFNRRWQAIFGLSSDEALGDGWSTVVHPDDRRPVEARWKQSAAEQVEFDMQFRLLRPDGSIRHVRSRAQAVTGAGGAVTGYVGSTEDVTARVVAERALVDERQRLAIATESGGIGVWERDLVTRELHWDARMFELFGLPGDASVAPSDGLQRVHADDLASFRQQIADAAAGVKDCDMEFRVVWADGSVRHLRGAGRVTRDDVGRPVRMSGVNWDVTALRRITAQHAEKAELLRVTLRSIGDAVITTDAQGMVTWLNPVAERMTGWSADEARARPLSQVFRIVNEQTRLPAPDPVAACLEQREVTSLAEHTLLVARDGTELGIEDSAAPIRDEAGRLLGAVLVFHDVSEQRRMSGEMSYRATHDALTGLVNRAEFETRLRRTLAKSQEDASEHALLFIDLDQFKLVNDACGHSAGDQLLQQVAKLLADKVRSRDTLARLGGDEFAVILEHCTAQQASRVAQQICERMDDFRFVHDERRFRIGTSIGLVPVDRRWATPAAVMQAADASCYAAKEAGRNRVHTWYDTDVAVQARHGEMQWATRLEQALDEDRFVLFGQKIAALKAPPGAPMHVEVLLRLRDVDGSLIAPGAFLPAAERFNLSSRIDRWVLARSIDLLAGPVDLAAIETLSINLSGQSIGDRAFHRHAIELLRAAGPLVCGRICLEITETAAVTNLADASLFIEQVHALGIRVALDDFGAGASSFGYLKTLAVDVLKIDGQFVKDVIDDPLDDVAVRCFVDVARVIGVKTVAEFVDRPEVLARMTALGVDYAQGFLLHRPEPIEGLFAAVGVDAGARLAVHR